MDARIPLIAKFVRAKAISLSPNTHHTGIPLRMELDTTIVLKYADCQSRICSLGTRPAFHTHTEHTRRQMVARAELMVFMSAVRVSVARVH